MTAASRIHSIRRKAADRPEDCRWGYCGRCHRKLYPGHPQHGKEGTIDITQFNPTWCRPAAKNERLACHECGR